MKPKPLLERLLWAASAVLAVVCVVLLARRVFPAADPTVLESAKAPPLTLLPVLAPADGPSDWLLAHFARPLPAQGPAPAGWSPLEASLDAASCGACHVQQYSDWQASWHANAMGPGVTGQLLGAAGEAQAPQCQRCHAPLAEQIAAGSVATDTTGAAGAASLGGPAGAPGDAEPLPAAPVLRAQGLSCAGCHVRSWARYGPPKADGSAPIAGAPHGGFVARTEFTDSAFCASCHDFAPGQKSLEGKLLEETWEEWRRTPYARDGVQCQGCHMPDGRHLWKGVHDPAMVRKAFTATARWERRAGRIVGALDITNTGAGHRFPTYTTPQITLRLEQLDAAGGVIAGTTREGALARRLRPDLKEELFDTRLMPGETHTLAYDVPLAASAARLRATVECWPDEGYRRFYTIEADKPDRPAAGKAQLEAALENTTRTRFVAWEETVPVP